MSLVQHKRLLYFNHMYFSVTAANWSHAKPFIDHTFNAATTDMAIKFTTVCSLLLESTCVAKKSHHLIFQTDTEYDCTLRSFISWLFFLKFKLNYLSAFWYKKASFVFNRYQIVFNASSLINLKNLLWEKWHPLALWVFISNQNLRPILIGKINFQKSETI